MSIVSCQCGFRKWTRRGRLWMVQCSWQSESCLRGNWMCQKWRGSLDKGGFNCSVMCEWTVELWNCKWLLIRYKLKEFWRHSEARLVNMETMKVEQTQLKELLASFQLKDQWNMDESTLFTFGPPDHGLAQKQRSRKWAGKFQSCSPLHATLMALRKGSSSSLGGWRSLNALVNKAWSHVGFTIMPIKWLGWQGHFLKSKFISFNIWFTHWLTL